MIKQIHEMMLFYVNKSAKWTQAERDTVEVELLPKVIEKGMRDFLDGTPGDTSA